LRKSAFRGAWRAGRRCLIPVTGFFEWLPRAAPPKDRRPFNFVIKRRPLFALAGLWERWRGDGQEIESCTIVTTEPNDLMGDHDRMPVNLSPRDYGAWLDPTAAAAARRLAADGWDAVPSLDGLNFYHPDCRTALEAARRLRDLGLDPRAFGIGVPGDVAAPVVG
jgi:putative SOS response-associated peptidase YedK